MIFYYGQMISANIFLVARIVKQVTGKGELEIDANVDNATAVWLTENYSFASKRAEEMKESKRGESFNQSEELHRLIQGHSTVDPDLINSWNFDVLKFSAVELMEICSFLFDVFHFYEEFNFPKATMNAFLVEVSSRYKNNPYHNFQHAVDVTQTLYRVISVTEINTFLSSLDIFSMLLAAIGHDVGHPGVNNAFLVKNKDELALRHNDR
jgi:hypothetical protein